MSWRITFLTLPYLLFALEWLLLRRAVKRRWALGVVTLAGFVGASKFCAFQLLGGDAFNPELPVSVFAVWGWLESLVWIGAPIGAVAAAGVALWRTVRRGSRPCGSRFAAAALVMSALLAAYGMYDGMRVASVREQELEFGEELPAAFDGYRIVHLSDLHCSAAARREKIAAIVERTNACAADLVVITGDFVDGLPERRVRDLEPLVNLRAKDGVWGCVGNHEHYWRLCEWEPWFAQWQVRLLRNTWTEIRRGGESLALGALDDIAFGPLSCEVFRGAPPTAFRIVLYHRPTACEFIAETLGAQLQLSGHTHGGAMPIIDRLVAVMNGGHVGGVYHEGRLTLHVSPGTGQWGGFPLRIFNPPEITVLVLRRRHS